MDQPTEANKFYRYYPSLFDSKLFEPLYQDLLQKCKSYNIFISQLGKEYPSRRISCTFANENLEKVKTNAKSTLFGYQHLPFYTWESSKIIFDIKNYLKEKFDESYDYCLAHIYRDGSDMINYHNDKEALNTDVFSISFGATRKFRFRKIEDTSGWEKEFELGNGDAIHMLKLCQRKYKHSVPTEAKVKESRINLTFRKLESK